MAAEINLSQTFYHHFLPEYVCCLANHTGSRNKIKIFMKVDYNIYNIMIIWVCRLYSLSFRELPGWASVGSEKLFVVPRSKHSQSPHLACPAPWWWWSTRRSSTTGTRLAGLNSKFIERNCYPNLPSFHFKRQSPSPVLPRDTLHHDLSTNLLLTVLRFWEIW